MASDLYIPALVPEAPTRRGGQSSNEDVEEERTASGLGWEWEEGGASLLLKCPGAEGQSSQGRKGGKTLETPDPYLRLSEPLNRVRLGGVFWGRCS